MQYFIGLVLIAAGFGMVVKTEWLIENFGTSDWAESAMATSGGSRLLYKLIGVALIFIGFLLITGQFQGFAMGTIGKIFIR